MVFSYGTLRYYTSRFTRLGKPKKITNASGNDSKKSSYKVGCVFPMAISSKFRMGQYRHDDHGEQVPPFYIYTAFVDKIESQLIGPSIFYTTD